MKINYSYYPEYKEVRDYKYKRYNDIVSTETYKDIIERQLNFVFFTLTTPGKERQAVIIVNQGERDNCCLLSLQFQIHMNNMYVTANFRSQSHIYGRPSDTRLICHVTTQLLDVLKSMKIKNVYITCNVGNYHDEPETWNRIQNINTQK